MHLHHLRTVVGAALLVVTPSLRSQEPVAKGVLELVSGERIAGQLAAGEAMPGFPWQSTVFDSALVFEATALSQATFDPDPATHGAKGAWRVVTTGGDVVFGDLTSLDATSVALATARHGSLAIPRNALAEIRRRSGGALVYLGPNCALEWQARGDGAPGAWRAIGTSLVGATAGAEVWRDGVFGADCDVDCTISWTGNAGFRLVFGAAADPTHDDAAVVVESWDDVLVAFHERPDGVDLVRLPVAVRDRGTVRLRCRVRGDIATFVDDGGAELGRLPMPGTGAGIALSQKHDGELRLEHLRIERTPGPDASKLQRLAAADVKGFDKARATFALASGDVAIDDVDTITFAPATGAAAEANAELTLQDGTRLGGEYAGVDAHSVLVRTTWAPSPVATAIDALKTLEVRGNTKPRLQEQQKLAIKDDRFLGKIVGWSRQDGQLSWRATLGKAPAVLKTRDDLRFDLAVSSAWFVSRKDYPSRILFTNRDCVPCRIVAITPATIAFVEPFRGQRREVPATNVKAIEFAPVELGRVVDDVRIEQKSQDLSTRRSWWLESRKRDRNFIDAGRRETILALPRKFKGSPPTHLVIAENGDVLRGILSSFTDQAVDFEMSLSSKASVPRDRLVAMVLFHDAGPTIDPVLATAGDKDLVLEVALDKETRVTIVLSATDAKSITGTSPWIGEVTMPYEDIVSMVSGSLRGKAPGFFTAWTLAPMKEPPY